ncbi:MAG: bifunctional nuclease family protein [Nanoarchaeota archaeon]|nr:bifunctional nuclease family protein [Nanoarchaeota archaeon]
MPKKIKRVNYKRISYVLLPLIIVIAFAFILLNIKNTSEYSVPLEGFEQVEISVPSQNVVALTYGCLQLTATTSTEQAQSILEALQEKESLRPNTHDLMKYAFEEYNIRLLAVKIEGVTDDIFFSKLVLQQGNKVLYLDSRPSDAIALALRMNKPIYIKKTLLIEYAKNTCEE